MHRYFASISDSDRAPGLNYLATVYNGIDLSLYPLQSLPGSELIFLGRIHPDKGVHLAIEVARFSGLPLVIAGIIQDQEYFRTQVEPYLDGSAIRYIGPVDVHGKNELFGSCREVITDGQTGFLVNNVQEAIQALKRIPEIDRRACRERVQQYFSIETMGEAYERVYSRIFDREAKR